MKKIIKTAEQQLQEILDKYGIKNLEYAGDCVYYAVSETNQVIAVRKDSEDATNDENGIRIEIYPPYEKLRANKDVLELLRNDAIGNLDYQYLGKLVCWEKFGDADCRPHPVNLYYVEDVIRVAGGDALYLTDEEDEGENGAEYKERHDFMSPYRSSIQQMKETLIHIINDDFKRNKQIYSDTPMRYADESGDAESVGANSCVGVCLQMSQDDKPALQLCFIYGDKFENPASSIDVPLEKLPVESLIQIYENLM